MCMAIMPIITACQPQLSEEQQSETKTEKIITEVKKEVVKETVNHSFTPESHPQLYQQWSQEWINIINDTMIPLVVKRIQAQQACNEVLKVDLSATSIVNGDPVLDVYCQNGEIFSVNQGHIQEQKQLYPNSKLFGKTLKDFTNACVATIKPYLIYPNEVKELDVQTQFGFDELNNELRMAIPITVKTGYDSEISHVINCRANNKLQVFAQLAPLPNDPDPYSQKNAVKGEDKADNK